MKCSSALVLSGAILSFLWLTGCQRNLGTTSSASNGGESTLVPIVSFQWGRFEEGSNLLATLRQNGFAAEPEGEGTKVFRILIPQGEAAQAAALLETNRIIQDQKATLHRQKTN